MKPGQPSNDPDAPVQLSVTAGVARITLNRPSKLNSLNNEICESLAAALRQVESDGAIRVLTLTGAGRAFVAGADVEEFQGAVEDRSRAIARVNDSFHEVIRMIRRVRVPVVAGVHGVVAGGGVAIALACDMVIAAEDVRFVPAYMKLAATPDAGTSWHVVRLLGYKQALEWYLLGKPKNAGEALAAGFVNRVVPSESLAVELQTLTAAICASPPAATAALKRLLHRAESAQFESQLDAERASFLECARHDDFERSVHSFLGKK